MHGVKTPCGNQTNIKRRKKIRVAHFGGSWTHRCEAPRLIKARRLKEAPRLGEAGRLSKGPRPSTGGRQSKNLYMSESPPHDENAKGLNSQTGAKATNLASQAGRCRVLRLAASP